MKKLYLSLLLVIILSYSYLYAQEKCGFAVTMEQARARGFRDDLFEAEITRLIQQREQSRLTFTGPVTLPVVFHVIYRNGQAEGGVNSPNVSQAQVQAQLNQINADYRNLSGSSYGVAGDVQIQFCLAQQDPGGSPLAQPGINRINGEALGWDNTNTIAGQVAVMTYVDATIKPATIWDPYRYVNIWVLEMDASGLLGYATFPSLSGLADLPADNGETDQTAGVVIASGSTGSVAVPGYGAPYNLGRTLTHELGHFFALRHIWGDATCGNDFCGDTPLQRDATSGCPTVGGGQYLQNCPSVGNGTQRMFENYMDYSDDGCMNTFTANQATRCQAVMDNSPRRVTLITSNACSPPVANAIAFLTSSTATNENPTVLTCPRYKEVTVSLKAAIAASGNATVTFVKGGTGTDVADYTITPSSVSFTNGDNTTKNITIRINDDATVESAETIVLTYNITGGGVVASSVNQTHTITVTDNDLAPVINNNGTITVFSQNFDGAVSGWATGSFIGTPGVNVWTISANGGAGITGGSAHITNNTGTNFLDYDNTSTSDVVLITPFMTTTGGTNLTLSFKYKSEGEFDGTTYWDYGRIMYSLDGNNFVTITNGATPYRFQGTPAATTANIPLPALLSSTTFKIGFRWTNDNVDGTPPPFLIDDVVVSTDATRIESTVSQPVTENVFSNQDVYLRSTADGQVLARIQNANVDIGCLTATLTQAGNTRVAVTTNTGGYLRTEKVIQVSPSVANTSVTYTGTLYFSTAEVQAWIDAGVPLNTLKILKVTDGTSLASTLNSTNSQIITPTFSDQSAFGYYAFTGNFTGFSQFMLASPNISLPVDLLTFEARPVRKSILLNWSTSRELNNKGFAIERSADGTRFEEIGWVDGKITVNTQTDYVFTDNFVQPGVLYYYRLRQTDIDERTKLSMIRQARIDESGLSLTVTPNPATDILNVFISGSTIPADVQLLNMQGQLVRRWSQVNASAAPAKLNISGLAGGVYMLHVQLPAGKMVEKIIVR
ncbi:MAG: T9SS type A sorting domain-containing protein [Chitinophagaceae bacterium]|nr:T9SS type A sorting domain-containing protein [Chitinophagaceae bacterium]